MTAKEAQQNLIDKLCDSLLNRPSEWKLNSTGCPKRGYTWINSYPESNTIFIHEPEIKFESAKLCDAVEVWKATSLCNSLKLGQ